MNATLNGTRRWTDEEMRALVRGHLADQALDVVALARRMGASTDKLGEWLDDGVPAFTVFRARLISYLDSIGAERPPSDSESRAQTPTYAVSTFPAPMYANDDDGEEEELSPAELEPVTGARVLPAAPIPPPLAMTLPDGDEGFDHLVAEIRKEFRAVDEAFRRFEHVIRRRDRLIEAHAALMGYDACVDRELIAGSILIGTEIEF